MILPLPIQQAAMTNITIDAPFIAAFFAGLAALLTAGVTGYIKIRQGQMRLQDSATEAVDVAEKAATKNTKAVERVHKIVNNRDTQQRKLIKELSERLEAGAVALEAQRLVSLKTQDKKKPAPRRKR